MKLLKTTTALGLILCVTAGLHAQNSNAPLSEPPVRPADSNTRLDITPTGTPIVNIATPDRNGVSYNRYNQFDVNTEGLIINNSRSVGSTVLGGQILANPNLRNSNSASLILNEVVSSNRSDLYGPIEIFGPTAALILANEAGITCDGCGFINVSRVALSSGKITFGSDGEFTGFAVAGGDVRVEGDGLLAGNVDFFDIVTSTANINASLYARDLVIAGGNGQYNYANRSATGSRDTPRIAIDSSLLGGMFANRIRLIGTGDGVGINLRGTLTVLEGPLEITSGGEITLRSAVAAGDVTLRSSAGNINVAERLYGGGTISLNAAGNISQSGDFLAAGTDVRLQSGGDISLSGDGLYAGLNSAGRLVQQGSISIQAAGSLQTTATQLLATGQQVINANSVNIDGDSALLGGSVSINALQGIDLSGQVQSTSDIGFSAQAVNLTGSAVGNGQLRITGDQIAIEGSAIGLSGADIGAATRLDISDAGSVQTNGALNIRAGIAENAGNLVGVGGLDIRASGNLNNSGIILSGQNATVASGDQLSSSGVINANGTASLNAAASASLSGTVASAGNLSVVAGDIALSGQLSSGNNLAVTSGRNLNAAAGSQIVAEGDLSLTAANNLTSSALISAGRDANLNAAGDSIIGGQVQTGRNIALTSNAAVINGQLISNANINLSSRAGTNISGNLSANNSLSINASDIILNSISRVVANNAIRIEAAGRFDNAGIINTSNIITVSANDFQNIGTFSSIGNISINAAGRLDQAGNFESNGTLQLIADAITLAGRSIGGGGIQLNAAQIGFSLTNDLQSGGLLEIAARQDLTLRGTIISVGAADITTAGNLNQLADINLGGSGRFVAAGDILNLSLIAAGDTVALLGNDLINDGVISANNSLNLRSLSGNIISSGDLNAGGAIDLEAANLIDISGNVLSNGRIGLLTNSLLLNGTINAADGWNADLVRRLAIGRSGSLLSGGALALRLDSFSNAGTLFAAGALDLDVASTFSNAGQIISERDLSINIQGDFANDGLLQGGNVVDLSVSGGARLAGTLVSGNNLNVAGNVVSISGTLFANAALSLSAGSINVSGSGVIFGESGLSAISTSDFLADGFIASGGNATISADGRFIQNGVLESNRSLLVSGNGLSLNGQISALFWLTANALGAADITGTLSAGGALSVDAANVTLSQSAQLASGDLLSLNAANQLTIAGALSSVGQTELSGQNIAIRDTASVIGNARIDIVARSNVDHFGLIQTRGDIAIAGENLALSGDIAGAGSITARGNILQIAGQISSNGSVALQGGSAVITNAVAAQGSVNLNFIGDLLVDSSASIASGRNIELISNTADLRGDISALGLFSASAVQQLTIGGSIFAGADIRLTAGDLAIAGPLQANNDIIVNVRANSFISGNVDAGRNLTVNAESANITRGLVANDRLELNANSITLSGSVAAGQAVGILAASTLDIAGDVVSNGGVALTAADLSVGLTGRVEAGRLLNIETGSADIAGLLRSGGDTNLLVGGALRFSGNLEVSGDLLLTAGALQTLATSQLFANGAAAFEIANSASLAGQIGAGQISLLIGADVTNDGTVYSAGNLSVDAAAFRNNANITAAGNLAVNAADIRLGVANDLQTGGILSLSAIDRLDLAGSILAVGNATFSSLADILQNADINLGAGGQFAAEGTLTQDGAIFADGNIDLTAATLRGAGNVSANGNLNLISGPGGIDYSGGLIALGNFNAASAGNLRLAGAAETNAVLSLSSRTIALDGIVTALGGVSLNSDAELSVGGSGALRSGSSLNIDVLSFDNNGLVTANADLTISTQAGLRSGGAIISIGDLALTAGAALTTDGIVQTDGNAAVNSAGALNIGGIFAALGNVTANAGSIAVTGTIDGGQAITLGAASSIELSSLAEIIARGDLNLTGNSGINNAGRLTGQRALRLTSLGNITNSGIVQSVGVQNWSGADIDISGGVSSLAGLNITAANVSLSSNVSALGAIIIAADTVRQNSLGTLVGGASLTIDAAQSAENSGIINSAGALGINAATLANIGQIASDNNVTLRGSSLQNGGLIEAGQILDIDTGLVTLTGDLIGLSALRLSADDIASVNSSRILANGSIVINAAGNAQLASQIQTDDAFTLTALGDISLSNEILVGGSLNIESGGRFNLTNNAGVVGSVTIRASELDLTGNILTNAGVNLRALGGSIAASGDIVADQSVFFDAASAVNLSGDVQSDGSIVIVADSVSIGGNLSAISQIRLGAGGAISTAAGSTLRSNDDIIFNGRSFDIAGFVESASDISLAGTGNGLIGGNLISGGALEITAANLLFAGDIQAENNLSINLAGDFTAASGSRLLTAQNLSLAAAGNVTNAGSFGSEGQIRIAAGADLTIAGSLQAGQYFGLEAANIAIAGSAASNAGFDVTTLGHLNITGRLTSLGAGNISAGSLNVERITGQNQAVLFTAGDLSIAAVSDIINTGLIGSENALSLAFGGVFNNSGSLELGGDFNIATANDLALGGNIFARGAISLAARDLDIAGSLIGQQGFNASGRIVTIAETGILESGSSLSINAADSLNIAGDLLALGNLNLSANNSFSLLGPAIVESNGNLSVNSNGAIISDLGSTLQALGNLNLTSAAATLGGDLLSGAALTLRFSDDVVISGFVSAVNSIEANFDELIQSGELISEGTIRFAGRNLTLSNNIYASNGANLALTGDVTLASGSLLSSNGPINISAIAQNIAGRIESNSNIALTAQNAFALNQGGVIATAAGLTLASNNALNISGIIAAQRNIAIGGGNANISGNVETGGSLALQIGALDVSGRLSAVGALGITAGRINIGTSAAIVSDDRITLTSSADTAIAGLVDSIGSTAINALGNISVTGNIQSGAAVTLSAFDVTQASSSGIFSGGTSLVNANGEVNLAGILSSTGAVTVAGNGIATSGVLVSDTGVLLSSRNGLLVSGQVQTDGSIDLVRSGSFIQSGGLISAGGTLSLSNGLYTNISGTFDSFGALTIRGAQTDLFGSVRTQNALSVTASGLNITGQLLARQAALSATEGSINLAIGGGVITVQDSVLSAQNTLAINGTILAGADTQTGSGIRLAGNFGDISLGAEARVATTGNVNAVAGGSFNSIAFGVDGAGNARGIEAAGNVSVVASGGSVTSGQILSDGSIALTSSGLLLVTAEVNALGAVSLAANAGTVNITSTGALRSETAGIAVTAGHNLINDGDIVAANGIALTSGGEINNRGDIYSENGLLSLNGGALLLGGTVYSEGTAGRLAINSNNIHILGLVGSDAALTIGRPLASLNIAATGILQSNAGLNLNVASFDIAGTLTGLSASNINVASGRLQAAGNIQIDGTLDLNASNALTLLGDVDATSNIVIGAAQLAQAGTITSYNGGVRLAINGQADINGLVESSGALSVSGQTVALGANSTLLSSSSLAVNASNTLAAGSLIGASGDITLLGINGVTIANSLRSNGNLTIAANNGAAVLSGQLSSLGNLAITADSVAIGNILQANGDISIATDIGNINIGNDVIAGADGSGRLTLTALANDVILSPNRSIFGQNGVFVSGRGISISGTIDSPEDVIINATNGSIVVDGVVNGDRTVSLATGLGVAQNINVNGLIEGRDVSLSAYDLNLGAPAAVRATGGATLRIFHGAFLAGDLAANGNILFDNVTGGNADLNIAATGSLRSQNGAISLNRLANLNVNGLISAQSFVDVNYANSVRIGASGRIQAINRDANGNANGGDIRLTYAAGAGNSGVTTIIDGTVVATRDIALTGGVTYIGGNLAAGRNLSLISGNYAIDLLNFGGSNIFDAPVSVRITSTGAVTSGGDSRIDVAGSLAIDRNAASRGYFSAGGNANLNAYSHYIAGDIFAAGALSFTNGPGVIPNYADLPGFYLSGSAQSSGALTILSGVGAGGRFAEITNSGILVSDGNVAITANNIFGHGTIGAGDQITLNAGRTIVIGGLVQSGRRIAADAGSNITIIASGVVETLGNAQTIAIGRDQNAQANISLSATNGILNDGDIYSTGSVAIRSINSSFVNGLGSNITALRGVTLQSNAANIFNQGSISAESLAIYQAIDFTNNGSFVASGSLLIDAPNITNNGLIGAGFNLTLSSAGNIVNTGTLFAGSNLTAVAGTRILNDEGLILAAFGNINLTAPELLNESSRIESLGGDVTINSGNIINRIKNLVIARGGSSDTIVINSGASQIVAAGDITINGGPTGTLLNSNSSILAGNNITITTGTVNNVADLVRTTRVEVRPTGRTIQRIEDANFDCREFEANSGGSVVPGSCVSGRFPVVFTTYREFEFAPQTITSETALPTIIQAGGTVRITAAQLGNGTVIQNINVNAGGNPNPNTSVASVNAQGNRNGFAPQPANAISGQSTTIASSAVGGRQQVAQGNFVVDGNVDTASVGLGQSSGNGAGTVSPGSNNANPGGNALNNNAGGANAVSGVTATVSTASNVTIGELTLNNATAGGLGANIASLDGITAQTANGVSTAGGDASGAAALANAAMTLTDANLADIQTPGNIGGNVAVAVATNVANGQLAVNQAQSAGAAVVGAQTNVAAASIGEAGGTTTIGGLPATPVLASVMPDTAAAVGALNGTDPIAVGSDAQDAVLIDGFNGIAIEGIIGADGSAGAFLLGFLRQFDLVNRDGGFDFANGNSLFTFDDSPNARFLFTTNRGFGELGSLFDSDYFFDQLDRDRETYFVRLGDGFFETQLISQQVRAATNQAQLPQFGSALEQAAALLQSAVTQQRSLGLSLGVALTSDQVAQLTTSLVWWVSAEVAGRTVLVPVLYLAAADVKEIQNGSIIAGTNVVANIAGDIRNTGTIAASRVVRLTADNDIVNASGGVLRGGTVVATAARDIINSGSSAISGGDIVLSAGRDVSIVPVTNTASESSYTRVGRRGFTSSSNSTTTVTGGTVAADNNLIIEAGRDITVGSATITAGGNAVIDAGRDVAITGESETSTSTEAWDIGKRPTGRRSNNGTITTTSSDFVGSNIVVAGRLGILAGNNVNITGSDITAGSDLGIAAGNAITIEAARSTTQNDTRTQIRNRGNQSTSSTLTHELSNISSGGNLVINTPGAVNIAGANLAAEGSATILAGSLNVTGVVDVAAEDSVATTRRSGFLSSRRTTVTTSSVDQTVVGSSIVAGNDIVIDATGAVNIAGSSLSSGNDTRIIAAGPVSITSLVENDRSSVETVVENRSLLGGIIRGVLGVGLSVATGGLSSPLAIEAARSTTQTSTGAQVRNRGNQSTSSTLTHELSNISSGGNLVINTPGAVNIAGANLAAEGSATILAGSLNVTGVVDVVAEDSVATTRRSGFLSSRRTTVTTSSVDQTVIGSSIVAGNDILIDATGAVNIAGSSLSSGNDTRIIAAGPVGITSLVENDRSSVETVVENRSLLGGIIRGVLGIGLNIATGGLSSPLLFTALGNNGRSGSTTIENNSSETNILSSINAGGDLNISSIGDSIRIAGATLNGDGAVNIAGQGVTITGVIDTSDYNYSSNSRRAGLLSSTRRTTTQDAANETAVSSTVSGGEVNITSLRNPVSGAGGNLDIIGSDVVGTGDVRLGAAGDINIGTLETTNVQSSFDQIKRSGLSINLRNLTAFLGVSNTRITNEETSTTNTGSLVGSSDGNLTVNAGRDLTITGSTLTSPGTTLLNGESVTIQNAIDETSTLGTTRSFGIGITAEVRTPLLPAINGAISSAQIATGPASDRTRAVAAVAGALAVANAVDAAPAAVGAVRNLVNSGNPADLLGAVSVSITAGINSSRSRTETTDQTVVGSTISGGDVIIGSRGSEGNPASGTIDIIGSTVTAARDLTLVAPGAITIAAATEIDTLNSRNRSFGISAGIVIGSGGGITPTASVNFGRGNSSGRDVTNIESVLTAGGTARVTTPDALTIDGSVLNADRVVANVGALTIESRQDTSNFTSRQNNIGLSASLNPAETPGGSRTGSGSFNFSSSREREAFISVRELAGIVAGDGGFDIDVAGATSLTGAVISSTSDAANNRLVTGTFSASDLENSETYRASQVSFGASISGIGGGRGNTPTTPASDTAPGTSSTQSTTSTPSTTSTQATGGGSRDNNNNVTTAGAPRTGIPGIQIPGVGRLGVSPPIPLFASGSQSSTTVSAIAPGEITIRPDAGGAVDAASLAAAGAISRDTAAAGAASLEQQFDTARREEIAQGFEAARELAAQTAVFFENRAREEREARARAMARERQLVMLGVIAGDADGNATRDNDGNYNFLREREDGETQLIADANRANARANSINTNFGAASPARILATALNGAAGSNVAGSLGSLAQSAAINVLQSLAVNQVRDIADRLRTPTPNADNSVTYTQNAASEGVRAALQALVGCAGSAASGSGSCSSAAAGAAASVVLNALINDLTGRASETINPSTQRRDANGHVVNPLTLEEQQSRSNLIATLVAGITAATGGNINAAVTAAQIETENNQVTNPDGSVMVADQHCQINGRDCTLAEREAINDRHFETEEGRLQIEVFGSRENALACLANANASGCAEGQARLNTYREQRRQAGISFDDTASRAREAVIDEIHSRQAVSPELNEALVLGSLLGLSAAELRTLASFPGGQLSSNYLPQLRSLVVASRRNPYAAAGALLGLVVTITAARVLTPDPNPALPLPLAGPGSDTAPPTTSQPGTSQPGSGDNNNDPNNRPPPPDRLPLPPPGQEWQVGTNRDGDAVFIDSFGFTFIRDARGDRIPTDANGRRIAGSTSGPPPPNTTRVDAFVATAPARIAELRGGLTNSTGARSGTVAVADINIPGLPSQLAAHSGVDTARNGFIGNGSQSLPATSEPNNSGASIFRNIDSEYRILDNISDQLRNNPNVGGSVTIFVELRPCNSCANVALAAFRLRHPNIQVQIRHNNDVRIRPARPIPNPPPLPPVPTRGN